MLTQPALMGFPVGWFSPTYKMLSEVWRDMSNVLKPITARTNVQEHRLELVTGGVVDMWSLDAPDSARGRKYKRVAVDEAAMVAGLEDAWQAAIRPTLTDYAGDAWFFSTPKGYNFFRTIYERGQAGGEWMSWKMPTSANPHIAASEIEAARRDLPERIFAQEYLAEFLQDGGGVFRKVRVAAENTPPAIEQGLPRHRYVIGVDWGRTNDATVFTVIDAGSGAMVCLDRMTQTDFGLQTTRLKALWERFNRAHVIAEYNTFGGPQVEAMGRMGVNIEAFQTTNASKAEIIDGLALAFEQGTLAILPDAALISELEAYESERLPSGLIRYGAPAGMHDDYVISLALAWYGAAQPEASGELTYAPQYTIGGGSAY